MKRFVFAYPGYESLTEKIAQLNGIEVGTAHWGHFPDGESKLKVLSNVQGSAIVIICSLDRPDEKITRLYLFTSLLRDLGVSKITLICPYLAYMRQDKVFEIGEGISARYHAKLLSLMFDELITVDPHLHRIANLSEIFNIKTEVKHAAPFMSEWILKHVKDPVLIGPDSESEQWVSQVAKGIGCPFTVSEKTRLGDREVKIVMKSEEVLKNKTPVLVDDIISTGRTMIETILHLKSIGHHQAICVAVHAVFAEQSYTQLQDAGATEIVTCNTIVHPSNRIDLTGLFKF